MRGAVFSLLLFATIPSLADAQDVDASVPPAPYVEGAPPPYVEPGPTGPTGQGPAPWEADAAVETDAAQDSADAGAEPASEPQADAALPQLGVVVPYEQGDLPGEELPGSASIGEPELGAVIVTGVRGGAPRTITNAPSPVDVIGDRELKHSGRTGLKEVLGAIVPAMTMPAQGGGGTSASVKPYAYRGLSGDYLLVLVNGKRRHTTALINNLSRVSPGSTPVDLDLIPANMISRIEILRDGAAAQYGSDAVSGVLNIILDESEGLTWNQTAGQTYSQGAPLLQQQLGWGTKIGKRGGFFRLTVDAKYHGASSSSGSPWDQTSPAGKTDLYYPAISPGVPDPREAGKANFKRAGGYGRSNRDDVINTGYNFELPVGKTAELYSFSTLSYRNTKDARGAFPANYLASLPQLYPNGFQAFRRLNEWDTQVAVGVRDEIKGWAWDLSSTYGRDLVRLNASNTLNPSLGPASPTSFLLGHQKQDLNVNTLDVTKDFNVGLATPLHLSLGLMHRYERFQNQAGTPDSYRDGGYVIPTGTDPFNQVFGGQSPSPGLVSFTGTTPADARALHRNNYAAYAEVSAKPLKPWEVVLAGRGERYDDSAGNVGSGKVATRYEPWKGSALRGGANTGFRAPSLAQEGFSTTQNTSTTIGMTRQTITSKLLNVDSPAAIALGARPLKPEKSVSVTAGFTLEPTRDLHFTADFYQTSIRDRILTTGALGTANNGGMTAATAIADIFSTAGIRGINSAQFFMNAVNTTTRGVDLVADYTLRGGRFGTFKPSAAFNFAATSIDKVANNPAQLAPLGVTLFGRQPRIDITRALPRTKLILTGDYQIWRFRTNLRTTRWGKYTEASTTAGSDAYFSARWIVDLDVSYGITDHVNLALGAYNLFNVYPQKHGPISATDGTGQYGAFSPIGLTGGFYYARIGVDL